MIEESKWQVLRDWEILGDRAANMKIAADLSPAEERQRIAKEARDAFDEKTEALGGDQIGAGDWAAYLRICQRLIEQRAAASAVAELTHERTESERWMALCCQCREAFTCLAACPEMAQAATAIQEEQASRRLIDDLLQCRKTMGEVGSETYPQAKAAYHQAYAALLQKLAPGDRAP